MAIAIYSALTGIPVDNQVAMTGEVSIRGLIKPIGGVIAKIDAARRAGAKKVIIPKENWQNIFRKIEGLEIIPITTLAEEIELSMLDKKEDLNLISADRLVTISH